MRRANKIYGGNWTPKVPACAAMSGTGQYSRESDRSHITQPFFFRKRKCSSTQLYTAKTSLAWRL
jgi:hypothetical protein